MTVNNFLVSFPIKIKRPVTQSQSRQVVTLVLGFPVIAISIFFEDPLLAGSLFIALIAINEERQLNQLVEKVNSCIKLGQVFIVYFVAAVFVSLWLNPANVPTIEAFKLWQQQALVAVNTVKLALFAINLFLMAVLFLASIFIRHLRVKLSLLPLNSKDKH